jgi:putative transcriptional regulator
MAVSYKKLWHLLLDKNMKKKDLQMSAKLTQHAMRKLSKDEAVTTDTLAKICRSLDCSVDDIMEVLPENQDDMIPKK